MRLLKIFGILVAIAVAFVVLAGVLLKYVPRKYYLVTNSYGSTAVYSQTECFIIVPRSTIVVGRVPWLHSNDPLTNLLLSQYTMLDGSTIAYRYADGKLTSEDFNLSLQPSVSGSDVVLTGYRDRNPVRYRWNGQNFEQTVIAKKSGDASEDYEEQAAGDKWKSVPLYSYGDSQRVIHVPLKEGELVFRVDPAKRDSNYLTGVSMKATLTAPGLDSPLAFGESVPQREITRAEFEALSKGGPLGSQPPSTTALVADVLELLAWVAVPFVIFVWKLWPLLRMKRTILRNLPSQLWFPPALPEQFGALDRQGFESLTRSYESLGFKQLLDYSLASDAATRIPAFCRLMVHSRENCFVEIGQIFPKKPLPVASSVQSFLSDAWLLGTGQRKPGYLSVLWRRPRAVSKSMPKASPNEIFADHLAMRAQMTAELGVTVISNLTQEVWFEKMRQSALARRRVVESKSALFFLPRMILARFQVTNDWRGDWPKLAAQRTQSQMSFSAGA